MSEIFPRVYSKDRRTEDKNREEITASSYEEWIKVLLEMEVTRHIISKK